jgi:endoglucanase
MEKLIFILALFLFSVPVFAVSADDEIKVDQLGYRILEKKYAVIAMDKADYFRVLKVSDNKEMFTDKLSGPVKDEDSGDTCYLADFSAFNKEGEYYIEVDRQFKSYPFTIGNNVYNKAFYKSMRAFYGQRCGTKVSGPDGFTHEACHTAPALYHASVGNGLSGTIDASGGWHDAGDYGRYMVNSGLSTATLLYFFERNKSKATALKLDFPYSNYKLPDMLEEIKYNLDWMLKMQAPNGGTYHKVTPLMFPGFIMAEKDNSQEYVFEVTSCATADFAAVMAIAARVFKEYDASYSDKCLNASIKAWGFLAANPGIVPEGGFKNPADTKTGQYGDTSDTDERLWAAIELFNTTGSDEFEKFIEINTAAYDNMVDSASWWRELKSAALISYCYGTQPGKSMALDAKIRLDLKRHADILLGRIKDSSYKTTMLKSDYIWGSNNILLNYSINLIAASELCKEPSYLSAAQEALHYVFGRNPFNMSYVTGLGSFYCMNIHHRPSAADGREEPWPGLLAGGPNFQRNDKILQSMPFDTPPMKCYEDNIQSYASNEVAINWNAPLVYVTGYFSN